MSAVVEQKPAEVAATITTEAPAAAVESPAVESAAAAETTAEPSAATEEAKPEEASAPAEETPATEEAKPIEEGILEHKSGSFPKNFLYKKDAFWFGTDAVEASTLAAYRKHEKNSELSLEITAWAASTGKGLLFFGSKTAPSVISLVDATEPATEGSNKFTLTAKGVKYLFKSTPADRDNWVSQVKAKIGEAAELAKTVPETEEYKTALEALKPAPKAEEPKAEETKTEEAAPAAEEPPKEEVAEEAKPDETAATTTEEAKTEEAPKEEGSKRRSASRKRVSILGFLGSKKEKKEEVAATEETKEEETPAEGAAEEAKPEESVAPASESAPAEAAATEETPAVEEAKEVKKEEVAATKASKRTSVFGFLKKAPKVEAPKVEAPKEEATTEETAPAVEEAKPEESASAEEAAPANEEATPAAEATEVAAEEPAPETLKTEKRKSFLPFGKKEKVVSSDEEGEKSGFSLGKLRATIRGRKPAASPKTEEAPAEVKEEAETTAAATEEAPKEEEEKKDEAAPAEESKTEEKEEVAEKAEAAAPAPVAATA